MSLGVPIRMAKADAKKVGAPDWPRRIGRAIERAADSISWTSKEVTAAVEKATGAPLSEADYSKWLTGERRAQFDRLLAVDALRQPLIVELARLDDAAVVEQTIKFRRRA